MIITAMSSLFLAPLFEDLATTLFYFRPYSFICGQMFLLALNK